MALVSRYFPYAMFAALAGTSALLLEPWQAIVAGVLFALVPMAWFVIVSPSAWVPMFFAAALLLPPLPIPLGDTGPHPALAVAALGLLSGLARLHQWRPQVHAVDVSLAALLAAMTLSLAFALLYNGAAVALSSFARVAMFGIGAYLYFASVRGPARLTGEQVGRATRVLYFIALAAAIFGCVDFVYQLPAPAGFEPQFLWLDSGVYRRAQGLFYESSTLGNFCSFFLVFIAVSLAGSRRLVARTWLIAGALVFATAQLLSFSRASVLACLLSLATLAVLERKRLHAGRALAATALLLAIAVVGLAALFPEVSAGYWGRFRAAWDNFDETPDRVLSGRLQSWQRIAGFIADEPVKTAMGIGYKTLPYTEHLGQPVIADNMYASMLVETGLVGLMALFALNAAILAASWRALRRGSFHGKWMFCFWVGESLQMLSGDILTYWRVLPLYFWVLAQAVVEGETHADPAARPIR